jgi:hypothetical protein
MTANTRRCHRAWTVLLTALLSIALFLTFASAVGLGLARADAAPASDSAAQPVDRAADSGSDIFGRTPESLQLYYYHALLPLVPKTFYPYYRAIVTSRNYLVGTFAFGSILSCVLVGLVVLTRKE